MKARFPCVDNLWGVKIHPSGMDECWEVVSLYIHLCIVNEAYKLPGIFMCVCKYKAGLCGCKFDSGSKGQVHGPTHRLINL